MENSISQPSTREREEFFSGPAEYPAESAALSPATGSGSAHAAITSVAAAGQSGGGGGLRPLSAPAPEADECPMCEPGRCPGGAHLNALHEDGIFTREQYRAQCAHAPEAKGPGVGGYSPLRIRAADQDADLAHGCRLKLSPADILKLKQEQDRQAAMVRRNERLIELIFAARQLAQSQLVRIAETGNTICERCGGAILFPPGHAPGCMAYRVLQALARLEETAADAPISAGAIDQADGAMGGER